MLVEYYYCTSGNLFNIFIDVNILCSVEIRNSVLIIKGKEKKKCLIKWGDGKEVRFVGTAWTHITTE